LCMAPQCEWLSLCEWRRLLDFRVEDPSGARKGGPNRTDPGPSRLSLVTPSLPWFLRWLCTLPLPFAWFWRCHPCVQVGGSPCMKSSLLRFNPRGMFLCNTSVLATIGSDFIKLMNTNKARKCSFELVVNPSFISMFFCIKITLPNACT
jgi:hypothetical protein